MRTNSFPYFNAKSLNGVSEIRGNETRLGSEFYVEKGLFLKFKNVFPTLNLCPKKVPKVDLICAGRVAVFVRIRRQFIYHYL